MKAPVDKRKQINKPVHTTKQGDLFKGYTDPKLVKDALKRGTTEYRYKKAKDGKGRSLLDYIRQEKREKRRERQDEMENAENGGTEYWGFRSK